MSKMTILAAALPSIALLTSCGATPAKVEIPPDILTPALRPDLPAAGASNLEKATYILAQAEWGDGAEAQIYDLAEIVCVFAECG